ncbi:hypothetical protein ACIA8G_23140 [Lentzea sp. NPDC051213]|uniref:hypothetical protein n=1 Tax=Lentzea sp. NPDC051213 TaxID=3364126 RepID=UPI00379C53FB
MTRDDSEDAVFEWAVAAALEPRHRGDRALRHAIDVAKPWILAAAETQEDSYAVRAEKVRRNTSERAARRPALVRVVLLVIVPTITWSLLVLSTRLGSLRAAELSVGRSALYVLGFSLVVLAVSYAGSPGRAVGRYWATTSLWLPTWFACAGVIVASGQSGWYSLVAFLVCAGIGGAFFTIVETALPTKEMKADAAAAEQALEEWRAVVLRDGVQPVLRAELGSKRVVLGTKLSYRGGHGLQKGGSLIVHQPVRAGRDLAEHVRGLNGGSFALAGPRGAGKTSLLKAFCQGAYRRPEEPLDLAIMVAAPVDYVPREFVLHLYARTCRAVISYMHDVDRRAVKRAGRRDLWWRSAPDDAVRLVRAARRGLQDVAWVQTRSGETSGKFGFRGAELAYKRGVSLAGRPATFPEVVDDFRRFVRAAARVLAPVRVVIAIDEMDRIGAGEPARRLLNEIKAIFDVPGCYYVVSVSTEAQHDFELSGMGLRSVFDSSFDEVVRVDYLDFALARGLISRSVEELPEVFVALAYVFSGGLARQLTRTARAILRREQGTPLASVTEELVADELERVCKTTGDALTALDDGAGVTALLRVLADQGNDLRDYRKAIQAAYDGENTAICDLRDRAAARVEFLAVVREMFTEELAGVLTDRVDALARARRYAGSNPATGLALLEEFSAETSARPAPEQPPQ